MTSNCNTTDPRADLIEQLARAGEQLPDAVRVYIRMQGAAVVPDLIAILEDEDLAHSEAPGEGYVPVHAATILRDLKAVEAIEPMLRVLEQCDVEDVLYSTLVFRLKDFGELVVEPALKAYECAHSDDYRTALAEILAGAGARHEKILPVLVKTLKKNPVVGAGVMADYGDPAALPYLSAALDKLKVDNRGGWLANAEIFELAEAIEELGGTFTPSQARKVQAVRAQREASTRAHKPKRDLMLPFLSPRLDDKGWPR
ncbi:MAG TPA: hypothetical protein V6D08_19335 [Candidatus Obscuribacterales bacterium]